MSNNKVRFFKSETTKKWAVFSFVYSLSDSLSVSLLFHTISHSLIIMLTSPSKFCLHKGHSIEFINFVIIISYLSQKTPNKGRSQKINSGGGGGGPI